jgi:hypothetical protein
MSRFVDIDSDLTVRLDIEADYTRIRWSSTPAMDRASVLKWTKVARAKAADRLAQLDLVIEALTQE